ncbi:MAG: hypothetical protein M1827_000752 [Pycnora praestabilis]|nr:MAG: hypothetical protein M1827_000752 [Pycnora praestabilis]
MAMEDDGIVRPTPRRPFDLSTKSSPASSAPGTPPEDSEPNFLEQRNRTRSLLNLASSALYGIYSPTGYDAGRSGIATPWGTGSQTPNGTRSVQFDGTSPVVANWDTKRLYNEAPQHHAPQTSFTSLVLRTMLLFTFGVAYGLVVNHLHDHRGLAPIRVDGIHRDSWSYLALWGAVGATLGSLLPYVDFLWNDENEDEEDDYFNTQTRRGSLAQRRGSLAVTSPIEEGAPSGPYPGTGFGAEWNPVVRSIGAFVGIAFAIRKLPWQSTLQASLTLSLVNPVLWYLVDRSRAGFILSTIVGLTGTALLLGINPDMVPAPTNVHNPALVRNVSQSIDGLGTGYFITNESVGVSTWIASVLFCSCVCFGNIGRKLALKEKNGHS